MKRRYSILLAMLILAVSAIACTKTLFYYGFLDYIPDHRYDDFVVHELRVENGSQNFLANPIYLDWRRNPCTRANHVDDWEPVRDLSWDYEPKGIDRVKYLRFENRCGDVYFEFTIHPPPWSWQDTIFDEPWPQRFPRIYTEEEWKAILEERD